jgi:hypothetical protein
MGVKVRWLKPLGKIAKFTFVKVPANLVGWNMNVKLFWWLHSFWVRSVNPPCPECDKGVLVCDAKAEPTVLQREGQATELLPWSCIHCRYTLLEEADPTRVREIVASRRKQRTLNAYSALQRGEMEKIARSHRIACRVFYIVSALTFVNAIYLVTSDAALLVALDWGLFSVMFWILGMKRAYRTWQVTHGVLFREGAFWYWFKHEKWLV